MSDDSFCNIILRSPEINITMNTRAVVIFHCIPRQKRLIATTHLPWCSWKRFVYTYFEQGCPRETWSMMDNPCFIACTMVPFVAGSVHWNHGDHVPFRKVVGKFERFEPRSHFKSRSSLIVRVNVVLNRTVVVNSDWRFDNLCGSHLQSQSKLYHVSWWCYTLVMI